MHAAQTKVKIQSTLQTPRWRTLPQASPQTAPSSGGWHRPGRILASGLRPPSRSADFIGEKCFLKFISQPLSSWSRHSTRVDLLRPQKSKMGRTRGWAWESPVRRTLDEDERKSFKASEGRGGACNKYVLGLKKVDLCRVALGEIRSFGL